MRIQHGKKFIGNHIKLVKGYLDSLAEVKIGELEMFDYEELVAVIQT